MACEKMGKGKKGMKGEMKEFMKKDGKKCKGKKGKC